MQISPQTLQLEVEDLRQIVINEGICPSCKLKGCLKEDKERGEVYCDECGFAQSVYSPQNRVSGVGNNKDCQQAPRNKLCFGDNLGSNLSDRDVYRIVRKNGTKNLGIRKIQIKNEIMKSQEKPITQRIKTYLSMWSKQFGWGDKVLFANALGSHAQLVGTFLTMLNDGRNSKEIAKGIFDLTVERFFGDEKIPHVEAELKPKKIFIKKARDIIILDKLVK